jgi:hypothetical protein
MPLLDGAFGKSRLSPTINLYQDRMRRGIDGLVSPVPGWLLIRTNK